MKILFVCMGNICRSPTAEGVFRSVAQQAGVEVDVDSAGTGSWHVGGPADERAAAAAAARGIELTSTARQVEPGDFDRFDLIVAMDAQNVAGLQRVAPDGEAAAKIRLMREFDPEAVAAGDLDVPDPYYGGPDGFEDVLDMVERASRGLLEEARSTR